MAAALDAVGHGDRPFDRLDDVRKRNPARVARQAKAAARAARGAKQAGAGEAAHQLLRGGKRDAGFLCQERRRQPRFATVAGSGGHHDDGVIGKGGKTHELQSD